MIKIDLKHYPVQGETYSLFGESEATSNFYNNLEKLTDELIAGYGSPEKLLDEISSVSSKKRFLKSISNGNDEGSPAGFILSRGKTFFAKNTEAVNEHLKNLSLRECLDKIISTTEEQLYLYMFEIELTNRIYKKSFLKSDYKIALLPHCLRDLERTCMSVKDEIDKYCKGCSKHCYINAVSVKLRENKINPYIWMEADIHKLFSIWKNERRSFGVLGIACIPELIKGMRMCRSRKIPVVGLPLDANRCARWMGEFHNNSLDMEKLEKLISD